jgi:hypothetical protein
MTAIAAPAWFTTALDSLQAGDELIVEANAHGRRPGSGAPAHRLCGRAGTPGFTSQISPFDYCALNREV